MATGKKGSARLVSRKQSPVTDDHQVRLNRFLAQCGVASRRACDRLIEEGRVQIDGKPVSGLGTRVSPFEKRVTVDGKAVHPESVRVFLVHKPRNILCTVSDPEERRTVMELLPDVSMRLYPVGRLDRNSEGLLLVTNDGDLAHRLTHPSYQVHKEYLVWTRDPLSSSQVESMLHGVMDEGEHLCALEVEPLPASKGRYALSRMVLGEGRNRHIRRMCDALDVQVTRIKRIRMAGLDIQDLPVGECRELTPRELASIKRVVGLRG